MLVDHVNFDIYNFAADTRLLYLPQVWSTIDSIVTKGISQCNLPTY